MSECIFFKKSALFYKSAKGVRKMSGTFGSRLRAEIQRLGITQADFAKRIGTTRGYVSMLCDDQRVASDIVAKEIAKELYVRKEWLLTGEGEKDVSRIEVLDDDETDIIREYRKIPPARRKRISKVALAVLRAEQECDCDDKK